MWVPYWRDRNSDQILVFLLSLTKVTKEAWIVSCGNCLYHEQAPLWKFVMCNFFPLSVRSFIPIEALFFFLDGSVGQPVGDSTTPLCVSGLRNLDFHGCWLNLCVYLVSGISALCVCTKEPRLPWMLPQQPLCLPCVWLPVTLIWIHSVFSASLSGLWEPILIQESDCLSIVRQLCHNCFESSFDCPHLALPADVLPTGSLFPIMA